eukprot:TRINITY_DN55638_c0_g1_i1.p1 TRINITY_DN55638_c0_g1~~TRINITY_DN55638_c0_g1_i1.p1  ORF type:complete len:430 (-),score=57.27 TRINITY_DN55638_c0_g1_i1:283-1572(-)
MPELAAITFFACVGLAAGLDNGLAQTPPMGWSSWNAFHRKFDEALFRRITDQMASNGMQAAGYEYINVDGGWWEGSDTGSIVRNTSGFMIPSTKKYPNGIKVLIDYIHSKGFKYGHYTDAGKRACNNDGPMSEGYEHQDATLFASWGVDMVKVDACAVVEDNKTIVSRWEKELNETGRPILFSNCHNGCVNDKWGNPYVEGWADWCRTKSNMARSSRDIRPTWGSVMYNLQTLQGMGIYGRPGYWNDPDFLEIGVGDFINLGLNANRAHFALWCITSSPLIASPDFSTAKPYVIPLLTDVDAIAVNQEFAGNAGDLLEEQGGRTQVCTLQNGKTCRDVGKGQVWHKPLSNREASVALLNVQEKSKNVTSVRMNISFSRLSSLGPNAFHCRVFDIWEKKRVWMIEEYVADVAPLSAKFLRISDCKSELMV